MVNAVKVSVILISLASFAYADLNLTPRTQEYELEGVKMRQLVFADGERHVTYSPPKKWEFSGGANRLVLHPAFGGSAEAVITVTKSSRAEEFDEANMKHLSDDVLASAPRDATNVTLVSQQLNPVLIDRKPTFLVVISYDYYGRAYQRSVMFLNRQSEQVQFQLTAYRNDFRDLQKAFESSHFSWQNL
jgi:hypothetical protein